MQTVEKCWTKLAGTILAVLIITLFAKSQTIPPPVISIGVTNTNQLSITVTNGVAYANYILYNQHVLNDPAGWTFVTNPVPGVTNFVVDPGPYFEGYYIVTGSTNWNNNGIPNWDYADPANPGLGVLTVSIVSPAQGSVIQ
jgi:hypothetical protein